MFERWHAEIDLALRDAELARDRWYEPGFRSELRRDPETALSRFQLFRGAVTARLRRRPERVPSSWQVRILSSRTRPIL